MKSMTLQEALTHTTRYRWAIQKAGESAITCANRVALLLGAGTGLHRIRESDVRRMVANLRFAGECSPATVNRHLSALRAMLQSGHELGAIKDIPAMPWQKEPRGRTRWLSPREQRELFMAINGQNPNVYTLCAVLVETGLRVGEALKLKWEDVMWGGANPHVVVRESKNGETRWVPLTHDAREHLRRRGNTHGFGPGPFSALSQSTVNHAFRAAREQLAWAAGDDEIVPHCLRHTCASRLVNSNVSLPVVQAWLGHRDPESTMRYAHVDADGLSAAARLLEGVG